jgi:hypothetical protein
VLLRVDACWPLIGRYGAKWDAHCQVLSGFLRSYTFYGWVTLGNVDRIRMIVGLPNPTVYDYSYCVSLDSVVRRGRHCVILPNPCLTDYKAIPSTNFPKLDRVLPFCDTRREITAGKAFRSSWVNRTLDSEATVCAISHWITKMSVKSRSNSRTRAPRPLEHRQANYYSNSHALNVPPYRTLK